MKKLLAALLLFCSVLTYAGNFNIDSLQTALDYAIEHRGEYEQKKLERIEKLRHGADCYALFEEFQSYVCDSALKYINLDIVNHSLNADANAYYKSLIKKAQVLSVSGLYLEAFEVLGTINTKAIDDVNLTQYYKAYADLYLYLAEYASEPEFRFRYLKLMDSYQDSILKIGQDRFLVVTTEASRLMNAHKVDEAKDVLETLLAETPKDSRDYAILTSTLSFVSSLLHDDEAERAYLIQSAIADIEAVVKENKSLRSLAELLYADGELKKADSYMQISMEDANFYNARLRNVQVSKMLPIINRAYQDVENRRKLLLWALVSALGLLVFVLVAAVVFVRKQHSKVVQTRNALAEANQKLIEANSIKEEYLGKFLELCSVYIDKLDDYRKTLNKKASTGKIEDVIKTLKQNNITENVLSEFYAKFDEAFLNIYPDFIAKFNSLMPEGEKIVPKEKNRLTTELRIYALIRLGITDSGEISKFLHYSITTIYTYRSKIKNKSLFSEDFEERVQKF